jgi:hypothetical protein
MQSVTRSSIPVSRDATSWLQQLREVHAHVRSALYIHEEEMDARSKASTAPHFVRGCKVSVVAMNMFLQGQTNTKLRYRQLELFTVEEHIGKHIYILELLATIRLHIVFHVNILRHGSTVVSKARPCVTVTRHGDDNENLTPLTYPLCTQVRLMDVVESIFYS